VDRTYKEILSQCIGFEWDKGNIDKNWLKHEVNPTECEQIFFNQPLVIQRVDISLFIFCCSILYLFISLPAFQTGGF